MREALLILLFILENLIVLKVELGTEVVNVGNLVLDDLHVGVTDDSDQEVHQKDKENEDVDNEENEPNTRHNDKLVDRVFAIFLFSLDLAFPDGIIRSRHISNGISQDLEKRKNEGMDILVFILGFLTLFHNVVSSTSELIKGSNDEHKHHHENQEGRDIPKCITEQLHQTGNLLDHSRDTDEFEGGNDKYCDVHQ